MGAVRNGRIIYTHMYLGSTVCGFAGVMWGVLVASSLLTGVQDPVFHCFMVLVILGTVILSVFLRVRIRYRVYLDKYGIHIRLKRGNHEILLPRSNFLYTKVVISPRGSSVIILSKEAWLPAELAYVSVQGRFPTDKDVVKYGLEYALNRLVRGESSEQDLMRQNVIMLQFNYARNSMYKFNQHFLEVWGAK